MRYFKDKSPVSSHHYHLYWLALEWSPWDEPCLPSAAPAPASPYQPWRLLWYFQRNFSRMTFGPQGVEVTPILALEGYIQWWLFSVSDSTPFLTSLSSWLLVGSNACIQQPQICGGEIKWTDWYAEGRVFILVPRRVGSKIYPTLVCLGGSILNCSPYLMTWIVTLTSISARCTIGIGALIRDYAVINIRKYSTTQVVQVVTEEHYTTSRLPHWIKENFESHEPTSSPLSQVKTPRENIESIEIKQRKTKNEGTKLSWVNRACLVIGTRAYGWTKGVDEGPGRNKKHRKRWERQRKTNQSLALLRR